MAFDWTRLAVGGATRPDSFSGMDPAFSAALAQMFQSAPPEIQPHLRVSSGYRSPERQSQLWEDALKKYGSAEAARKWVAPPGRSKHNHGHAADLKYLDDSARAWAHENASKFGLAFPLSNENWHIELASARQPMSSQIAAQQPSPPQASGTPAPPLPAPREVRDHPIGSMAPTPVPQAPQGMSEQMMSVLGSMVPQTPQPQFQPVEMRGPSAEQAAALSNFLQALKSRLPGAA